MVNFRQQNLDIFEKPEGAAPIFQPRIDYWVTEHSRLGTLPAEWEGKDILEIHDSLHCSIRPYKMFNPCFAKYEYDVPVDEEVIAENQEGRRVLERYHTPHGNLERVLLYTKHAHHTEKWPVESVEQFPALRYILERPIARFDAMRYASEDERLGLRGAPQMFIPRVNVMLLMVHWMGMENFMMAEMVAPDAVVDLVHLINQAEEEILRVTAESPVPIINYGDNVDCNMVPPHFLLDYIAPQYHRRTEVFHSAGKFVHSHFDGSLKAILPYLKEMPLDGFEAFTPEPQGDVTLEEIRKALPEGKVLLDVLPMVCFLPDYPLEKLDAMTDRIIELFAPKLILGVSDEISPNCDIKRIRRVADRVHKKVGVL